MDGDVEVEWSELSWADGRRSVAFARAGDSLALGAIRSDFGWDYRCCVDFYA